jgi:proline dehydrogenase
MIAALIEDHDGLVHYETLCTRMAALGYAYTTDTDIRNYVRHAKAALASIGSQAKIVNYSSMGYSLKGDIYASNS